MSKVIIFSKVFPTYHPKAGEETNFIQKFWKAISVPLPVSEHHRNGIFSDFLENEVMKLFKYNEIYHSKYHTIRKGNRFKVGDKFSPRVWQYQPYKSKQVIIADDTEVKQIFDFEIKDGLIIVDGRVLISDKYRLAENDGLNYQDFEDWFKYPNEFKGQIICWNDKVSYE